jgi:outer membrane protein assembly factor BamB
MTHDMKTLARRFLRVASMVGLMLVTNTVPVHGQLEELPKLTAQWEDTEISGGGLSGANVTLTQRHTTFVIGNRVNWGQVSGDGHVALIKAFDARTGEVLWSDQRQALEDESSMELMTAAVVKGRHLVVGGMHFAPEGHQLVVWAYDARTGERRWSWQSEPLLEGTVDALVIGSGRVIAATYERPKLLINRERLRAFSLKTGDIEWMHDSDAHALGGHSNAADECLAVVGRRVAYAGNVSHGEARLEVLDIRNGDVLWTHTEEGDALTQLTSVVRQRSRFVLGGAVDGRPYLASLSARNGKLGWTKQLSDSGSSGIVRTLAANGRSLVAAVTVHPNLPTSMLSWPCTFHGLFDDFTSLTQVYSLHPTKGEVRWSVIPYGTDQPGTSSHALQTVIQGKRLAVLTTPYEPATYTLSARLTLFDVSTGDLSAMTETPLSSWGVPWAYLGDVALTRTHAVLGTSFSPGYGSGWWKVEGIALEP